MFELYCVGSYAYLCVQLFNSNTIFFIYHPSAALGKCRPGRSAPLPPFATPLVRIIATVRVWLRLRYFYNRRRCKSPIDPLFNCTSFCGYLIVEVGGSLVNFAVRRHRVVFANVPIMSSLLFSNTTRLMVISIVLLPDDNSLLSRPGVIKCHHIAITVGVFHVLVVKQNNSKTK